MPDNGRPILVPAAESTALDLQHLSTDVSTHVLAPDVAPPEDDEGLHFRDLWRIVVKRKWVVFAVIVLALATALVSTMMQTPIYRATITIKIEREAAKIVDFKGGPVSPEAAADIWMRDVLQPSLAILAPAIGPGRDPLQAYCDVLEEKWLLSEAAGRDVGLEAALDAYLSLGAPAPEEPGADGSIALDIDWSGGFDSEEA